MANRSDRRGGVPITSVAHRSRAIDWLPARDFPSWPGRLCASVKGPEIRLQSTYAVYSPLALKGVKSRYACQSARDSDLASPNLADLQEMSVGISEEAADLSTAVDGRCQEFGTARP